MKGEFSAFPKAFSGNVPVFVGAGKQLLATAQAMDKAVFLGAGASGEPAGLLVGSYSITSTAVSAAPTWAQFRTAITAFMIANAITSPSDVAVLVRPEVWSKLDGTLITTSTAERMGKLMAEEWEHTVELVQALDLKQK